MHFRVEWLVFFPLKKTLIYYNQSWLKVTKHCNLSFKKKLLETRNESLRSYSSFTSFENKWFRTFINTTGDHLAIIVKAHFCNWSDSPLSSEQVADNNNNKFNCNLNDLGYLGSSVNNYCFHPQFKWYFINFIA